MRRKVVIIGSGPAAWTAALYAARAELQPLVYAGFLKGGKRGGQLTTTTEVENYPGFPMGVMGPELVQLMEEQARRFGVDVLEEDVLEVELQKRPFLVKGTTSQHEAETVIVATGAYAKRLSVKGDKEFWNRGISACAVCDGALPLFRGQPLAVFGGGDSACEEADFLTKFASKVYLILRRGEFRASKIMQHRATSNKKIEVIYYHELREVKGGMLVERVVLENVQTQAMRELEVKGVFYAIGHEPNTSFLKGQVAVDESGYLLTKSGTSMTSVEGVFAAGDVCDKRYRQAVTAAGMGCMAALDAEKWLAAQEHAMHK